METSAGKWESNYWIYSPFPELKEELNPLRMEKGELDTPKDLSTIQIIEGVLDDLEPKGEEFDAESPEANEGEKEGSNNAVIEDIPQDGGYEEKEI